MNQYKKLFESKTFWGGLMAVAAGILGFLGYIFLEADQERVIEIIMSFGAAIGGIIAIYGRISASKLID